MRKMTMSAVAFLVAWCFAMPISWAQPHDDKERAELAKALKGVKTPLQQGLTASAKEGKPISAKYEVEEGKLQLSIYTMKGDNFSEVIRPTGTTTEEFTVDVDDCGEPGTADTFGIKTMSYSNGPSTLIGGNIQIHK